MSTIGPADAGGAAGALDPVSFKRDTMSNSSQGIYDYARDPPRLRARWPIDSFLGKFSTEAYTSLEVLQWPNRPRYGVREMRQ